MVIYQCPSDQCVQFMCSLFNECVYDWRSFFSWFFGIVSMIIWIFAQFPQLVKNFKLKRSDALSEGFLWFWIIADSLSLIGLFLVPDPLMTQYFITIYFVTMDTALMISFYLYKNNNASLLETEKKVVESVSVDHAFKSYEVPSFFPALFFVAGILTTALADDYITIHVSISKETLGIVLGWISSEMFHGSRIFQIIKTFRRKTVEGLSISMFMMALFGNLTYALAILFSPKLSWSYLKVQAPWLAGSAGTIIFDTFIFFQWKHYTKVVSSKKDSGRSSPIDLQLQPSSKMPLP